MRSMWAEGISDRDYLAQFDPGLEDEDEPETEDENEAYEPDMNDEVLCCPDCETPNQFGELCARCQRERDTQEDWS